MSRGFKAALIGLALTVVAKVGPWHWPAWPAVTVLDFFLARTTWTVVPFPIRALGLVALILINTGFWAGVAWMGMWGWGVARGQRNAN